MKNLNDVVDEVINSAKNGSFDEVLNKTKVYAERATRRSAERLEISKKKIELLDSKTKLSKAFEKYGRLMYENEPSPEAVESAEAEILLHKTKTETLEKEIAELREVFTEPSEQSEPAEVEVVDVSDEL